MTITEQIAIELERLARQAREDGWEWVVVYGWPATGEASISWRPTVSYHGALALDGLTERIRLEFLPDDGEDDND